MAMLRPLCLALLLAAPPAFSQSEIRYGRDIRPILSANCFFCHGPDPNTREEDLRLDIRDAAIAKRAFVPGDAGKSRLIKLINAPDERDLMPPPESHKSLTQEQKQLLHDWIEAGAEYEDHWAYVPPRRNAGETIDTIVARELEAGDLTFSPPADPATLLRRLSFDVIGLPPTPAQVASFAAAHARDPEAAIRAAVDELLDSPHFGERMAISWLDLVRYADTVGYHGDIPRSASPYRDYVINAFNADMPFDQFTIEQLAGDLLPDATLSQKVAASYNRLNQLSEEGGIQDAEYLAKYQAERVRTTSSAWLGSTLACAECHDHKFDPFTAKDFYAFAAFFSDILEKGAWNGDGRYQEDPAKWMNQGVEFDKWGPLLRVPAPEQSERLQQLDGDIARQRQKLETAAEADPQALSRWIGSQRELLAAGGPADAPILDNTLPDTAKIDRPGYVTREQGPVRSGTRSRRQQHGGLVQHIAVLKHPVTIREGDEFYLWVHLDVAKRSRALMLQANVNGDWSHRAYWGEAVIPYGKDNGGTAYHRAGDLPQAGEWVRLTVPAAAIGLAPGSVVGQLACTQFGGLIHWDTVGLHGDDPARRLGHLPADAIAQLQSDEPDHAVFAAAYRESSPELRGLSTRLSTLEDERNRLIGSLPTVPATISAAPREIRLLNRGDWQDRSGPVVLPAPPEFLAGITADDAASGQTQASRLDLARWMVDRDNPLTARVFANRLWAHLFGIGLSKDTGDFGMQGEFPSHPELLDWLAVEFMENQWSVKHLLRSILLSRTYQQASHPDPAIAEVDPDNRLLTRQSQLRLPAELIRDNALAVSGLLNPAIGGASAKPYQPAGYYRHLNFPTREYQPDQGELLYRRGVYTHWQRTFLHPMLKTFDAPAREECTSERSTSNTPLQALNLLNDPTFTEAARALAASLLAEPAGENDLAARAWNRCLSRPPTAEELQVINEFHASELERFSAAPAEADALLAVGASPRPPALPPVPLAAATSLARVLLNLHETITRY